MRDATHEIPVELDPKAAFQSTRPMRDATNKRNAVPVEGIFQSTRPMRDATMALVRLGPTSVISIHASHAGRDKIKYEDIVVSKISIHASHAGRDPKGKAIYKDLPDISIHASHAGRDCG